MTKKSAQPATSATGKRKPATAPSKVSATTRKKATKRATPAAAATQPDASLPKRDQLIALLSSPSGTTIDAMTALTGWQAHTVRAVISAVLRKKLGLPVVCEKTDQGRLYKIAAA